MKRVQFTIIAGSKLPKLTIPITDDLDAPIDFTLATAATLVVSRVADAEGSSIIMEKSLDIVGLATEGKVRATWTSAEIAALPRGTFVGQVEVDFSDGGQGIWGEIDFVVWPPRKKKP